MDLSAQDVAQTVGNFVQDLVSMAPKKRCGIGQLSRKCLIF